jgi:hypothetical protein
MAQGNYAEKVAKLIAKAEGTDNQHEAEAFFAKAQELMTEWAITDAMVDAARGVSRDEIGQHTFVHGGVYSPEKGGLAWVVIRANGCKGVYWRSQGRSDRNVEIAGKVFSDWYKLEATGFKSDLDRAAMLESSLQLQMAKAMNAAWRAEERSHMRQVENRRWHKSFMEGFASGVAKKLREATAAGRAAAEKAAKMRGDGTSVELVVRSRQEQVDEWYAQCYGDSLRTVNSGSRKYDSGAYGAGNVAGSRADVGQSSLRGRQALHQ